MKNYHLHRPTPDIIRCPVTSALWLVDGRLGGPAGIFADFRSNFR